MEKSEGVLQSGKDILGNPDNLRITGHALDDYLMRSSSRPLHQAIEELRQSIETAERIYKHPTLTLKQEKGTIFLRDKKQPDTVYVIKEDLPTKKAHFYLASVIRTIRADSLKR